MWNSHHGKSEILFACFKPTARGACNHFIPNLSHQYYIQPKILLLSVLDQERLTYITKHHHVTVMSHISINHFHFFYFHH